MPCDTQRTITTKLEAARADVLARGLTAAGFTAALLTDGKTVSIQRAGLEVARLRDGTLSSGSEATLTAIKRAYAGEAVRTAARKYGWAIKQTAEADTLTIVRRTA